MVRALFGGTSDTDAYYVGALVLSGSPLDGQGNMIEDTTKIGEITVTIQRVGTEITTSDYTVRTGY